MTPHWADIFRTWVWIGVGLVVFVIVFGWFKYLPRFMSDLRAGERALREQREHEEARTSTRTTGSRKVP